MATDQPECPVCLEPYGPTSTVPHVLPCGHSLCKRCISLLPPLPAHPSAVRCPSCAQILRLPSSLPRNIDLLRFCGPDSGSMLPDPNPVPKPEQFLPVVWTEEIVRAWERWILPQDFLELVDTDTDTVNHQRLLVANRLKLSGCENKKVNLYPIGISHCGSKCFRFSYIARIMESICQLEEKVRNQLAFLLETFSRPRRIVCTVFGLWMKPDEEMSSLYLVSEKLDRPLSDILSVDWNLTESFDFGMIGMELSEAVLNLHSKSIIIGFLGLDCFYVDEYMHCLLDLNVAMLQSKIIRRNIQGDDTNTTDAKVFVSPELFASLHEGTASLSYSSDVWSLGCILAEIILGDAKMGQELFQGFCSLSKKKSESFVEAASVQYEVWKEKVVSRLEPLLLGTKSESLLQLLSSCLNYHPELRPQVRDIWCCIRSTFLNTPVADFPAPEDAIREKTDSIASCLFLEDLCHNHGEASGSLVQEVNGCILDNTPNIDSSDNGGSSRDHSQQSQSDVATVSGLQGSLKFETLQGHRDCITGLAVGGGYLFSSSFDKTVNVWSLEDFSLVQSLKGHEHKINAVTVVDGLQPLCISGDSGRSIIVWRIGASGGQEILKKWDEHSSWCYSGVHALAVSEGFLYSGSGDKSIKAWSLQDYSLICTMTGHKSTISSLVVGNGILYSGSWDGNVRLWCLSDHSLLSVLGDDSSGSSSILSLSVHRHLLASSHENGTIKIWKDDLFARSMQVQDGAVFAVQINTKWLFTGGWNKLIDIHKLSENELRMDVTSVGSITCDSVITSLLYWQGKLFVGFSNKEIKVYYYGK